MECSLKDATAAVAQTCCPAGLSRCCIAMFWSITLLLKRVSACYVHLPPVKTASAAVTCCDGYLLLKTTQLIMCACVPAAASYQTAATSQSFQSASTGNSMFSATSRATNSSSVSAATAASAATSASQWPRAYVPPVGVDLPTDSGSEGMPSPSIPLQPSNQ